MADLRSHAREGSGCTGASCDHDVEMLPFRRDGNEVGVHQQLFCTIVPGIDDFRAQAGAFFFRQILEHVQAGAHLQGDVAGDGGAVSAADPVQKVQGLDAKGIMRILAVFADHIDVSSLRCTGAAEVFFVVPLALVPGDAPAETGIVEGGFAVFPQGFHIA